MQRVLYRQKLISNPIPCEVFFLQYLTYDREQLSSCYSITFEFTVRYYYYYYYYYYLFFCYYYYYSYVWIYENGAKELKSRPSKKTI